MTPSNRAVVLHAKMDLRVERIPVPVPGPGEVLLHGAYGGICGSDLHYVRQGRGSFSVVTEPLVLGHEISATVAGLGPGVTQPALVVGAQVAVSPASACRRCPACLAGRPQVCPQMRYLGSAATLPHTQGAFAQQFVAPAESVVPLPDGLSLRAGALAEPLAVAIHATRRAGNLAGAHILVTGAGPIGLLSAAAAKAGGAATVTITDVQALALSLANRIGVERVLNVAESVDRAELSRLGGSFDVVIEASGSPAAIMDAARAVRGGGCVVQLGMPPMDEVPVALGAFIAREADLRTSLRFGSEFPEAVRLLGLRPELAELISAIVPLDEARRAFDLAADRTTSSKILLDLSN